MGILRCVLGPLFCDEVLGAISSSTIARELVVLLYSNTCVKRPLTKRLKLCFQDQVSLNEGQTHCRMLQWEHSAILSTFIKLPFVFKIFILLIFEWSFYTGFTAIVFCVSYSRCRGLDYFHLVVILTYILYGNSTKAFIYSTIIDFDL